MPQPQTPSDSDSDEEGGGDFVFMDSVQSVFGALNPWRQTSQDENEIQVGALSQLDTAQGPSTDAPQVPEKTDRQVQARLRQLETRASMLERRPSSAAKQTRQAPSPSLGLGQGVASFIARYEEKFGKASDSQASRRPSREIPPRTPSQPLQTVSSSLVFETRAETRADGSPRYTDSQQWLPAPGTPASTPDPSPFDGLQIKEDQIAAPGTPISAPGTPVSLPPDEAVQETREREPGPPGSGHWNTQPSVQSSLPRLIAIPQASLPPQNLTSYSVSLCTPL